MNHKITIALLLSLLYHFTSYAQETYELSGTVTSIENNFPIPGASVLVQGTSNGTATDFDGKYKIIVKSGDILQFSYIGYAEQSITITNQKTLDIVLEEDSEALDEIVVVGYGTRKKSHNTGAIAQVKGGDIAAIQATRVDEALAGKLSGVFIQNQNPEPGANPKIQIRKFSYCKP